MSSTVTKSQEQWMADTSDRIAEQDAQGKRILQLLEKVAAPDAKQSAAAASMMSSGHDGAKALTEQEKSFGDFLLSVARANKHSKAAHSRLTETYGSSIYNPVEGAHTQVLSEDTGNAGGYLVPQEYLNTLLVAAWESSIVRSRAFVQPMASRSIVIPALDHTTAPTAGNSAQHGGVKFTWGETDTAKTSTEPDLRQIELIAYEGNGYTEVGNALMADSGQSIGALLTRLFGETIAWSEDYAFLRGDGVGKPTGILGNAATKGVARGTSTTFKLAEAALMLGSLLPGSMGSNSTAWIMSITVLEQLIQLTDGTNVVWIPNARDPMPMTLFNIPVVWTEKLPALGTAGDVMLCDFSYYVIGDRQQTEIASSEHANFTKNQTVWRFSHRVDGKPWLNGTITMADTSTTVSPFVSLNA